MLTPKRFKNHCPKIQQGVTDIRQDGDKFIFVMVCGPPKEFDLSEMLDIVAKKLTVTDTFGNTELETNYLGKKD